MQKIFIPQVVVETPAYLNSVEKIWDEVTQTEFKNYIAENFLNGDIIPNTGGLRKIRWQGSGRGKRGGARIIYYLYNENFSIYLLFAYPKNEKDELTEYEKKLLRYFVQKLKNYFRGKE